MTMYRFRNPENVNTRQRIDEEKWDKNISPYQANGLIKGKTTRGVKEQQQRVLLYTLRPPLSTLEGPGPQCDAYHMDNYPGTVHVPRADSVYGVV